MSQCLVHMDFAPVRDHAAHRWGRLLWWVVEEITAGHPRPVTAEGNEVVMTFLLVAFEAARHDLHDRVCWRVGVCPLRPFRSVWESVGRLKVSHPTHAR